MEKINVDSQIVLEKERIANPAPLGLASFALTTFILSAHNAGWAQNYTWVGLGFFYGGLGQFIAGMWEFKKNNTFGATAFSTYGSFWMGLSMHVLLSACGLLPVGFDMTDSIGWYEAGFFIFNTYMVGCSLLTDVATLVVFVGLELTLGCNFIGHLIPDPNWIKAGGYFGVFTAAAAWYASFANCFNTMAKRPIVFVGKPVLRLPDL